MKRLRAFWQNLRYPRIVSSQTTEGHTARIQKRFLLIFWRTVQTNKTHKEFDDVIVELGVTYFAYLGRNRKALGISRQNLRSRTGRFGKKVARKSVGR